MSPQDWRSFLARLESRRPGEIVREKVEIHPEYDVSEYLRKHGQVIGCRPILFESIKGKSFPVLTNLLASRERLALGMDVSAADLSRTFASRSRRMIPPRVLPAAPFQANCWEGVDLDLARLPVLTHFLSDGGPYLTAGLVVARDPYSGAETLGYHRLQYKGPDTLGLSLHSRHRLWEYQRRAERMGADLEAAVVLGVHPNISLGSLALAPYHRSKYEAVGSLFGASLEVARCATVDLAVPAWAEMVIEGAILGGRREPEGPFTEFAGSSRYSTGHVFQARAVYFRDDAIYQSITPGRGAEHTNLMAVQRESELFRALDALQVGVVNVHAQILPTGLFSYTISVQKDAEEQPARVIHAALSMNRTLVDQVHKPPSARIVVVDGDVDVFNEADVREAVAARGVELGLAEKYQPDLLCVDATRPVGAAARMAPVCRYQEKGQALKKQ